MINKITYFQLDNLINNRVPFMFYNMGQSITDWYNSISLMHLNTYQVLLAPDQVLLDLSAKQVPKDYAIVLLCDDGKISLKIFTELEKLAYTNVYVVDGGYQQLVTERKQI